MKTKLFTLFLAVISSVGTMFAGTEKIGDLWYSLNANNKTASVAQMGDGYPNLVIADIPSEVEYNGITYRVTGIGYQALAGSGSLTSVTIPNSVKYIDYQAFAGCISLTSIVIGDSVTSIGEQAFKYCFRLTSINIPNSITSIGVEAFAFCSSLPVENNLSYADTYLAEAVDNTLSTYTIKEGTRWIGYKAFSGCSNLKSITIPNSVTTIQESAFKGCSSLKSVNIPNNVTLIDKDAFQDCSSLSSIELPNSIGYIREGVFMGCSGLLSVTIHNGITSIDASAFSGCRSLTSIELPNSIQYIFAYAFAGCDSLTTVTCYATYVTAYGVSWPNQKMTLYVPGRYIDSYKNSDGWKRNFDPILPITAEETETNTIKAEPSEYSVAVSWVAVNGAVTYELVIKDKNGKVICTLIFNSQGQLQSIAFYAPANGKAPQQTQSAGFSFVVTGLEEGTDYDLTITAKDESGKELDKKETSFHTNGANGIEDIVVDEQKANKILLDGQIYILRGEHVYDAQGAEVR